MRAVAFSAFDSAPSIQELDVPEPAQGEVRVRVHAASVNGFDLAVANGYLKDVMEHRFPVVLGKDFAGTVDALGTGVTGYMPGDRVFGVVTKPYLGDGSFAEFVTVPASVGIAQLPDSVDFAEGAALGLAGTAALAAVEAADLESGQTIVVAGATGGVGTHTVQLAAATGAHVIATAHSDEEKTLVTGCGASGVVDYAGDIAAEVLAAHPGGVDAVIHLAGDPAALLPVVREGGRFVSTLLGSPQQLPTESVTVLPIAANPTPGTLARIAQNQEQARTRVTVQRTYGLDQVSEAFTDFAGGTLGKLLIRID
ncbi:MAG: NADP-dependent oxidoreductase [Nocardioidaceae bacterium]